MSSTKTKSGFAFECDGKDCGEAFEPPTLGRGSAPRPFPKALKTPRKRDGLLVKTTRQANGGTFARIANEKM